MQSLIHLQQALEKAGTDYLLDQRSAEEWRIRFIGPFQGRDVVWHGYIRTLHNAAGSPSHATYHNDAVRIRQYIDITEREDGYGLQVALNLPILDEAAILRTIIMIRKYKRLRAGRHEYGEWVEFRLSEL